MVVVVQTGNHIAVRHSLTGFRLQVDHTFGSVHVIVVHGHRNPVGIRRLCRFGAGIDHKLLISFHLFSHRFIHAGVHHFRCGHGGGSGNVNTVNINDLCRQLFHNGILRLVGPLLVGVVAVHTDKQRIGAVLVGHGNGGDIQIVFHRCENTIRAAVTGQGQCLGGGNIHLRIAGHKLGFCSGGAKDHKSHQRYQGQANS